MGRIRAHARAEVSQALFLDLIDAPHAGITRSIDLQNVV